MPNEPEKPRYTWPWFLLAAVILGVVVTAIWLGALVRQTREQRDPDPLFAPTRTNATRL
jgi:hypothetical protein